MADRNELTDVKPAPKELGIQKLPWLNTFVSLLRRYLVGTYHGVRPKLLQLYLDEFAFRGNRRFEQARILQSLIRAHFFAKPITLAELCYGPGFPQRQEHSNHLDSV